MGRHIEYFFVGVLTIAFAAVLIGMVLGLLMAVGALLTGHPKSFLGALAAIVVTYFTGKLMTITLGDK